MGRGKRISRGRSRGPAEDESARKRDRFRLRSETQRLELYHYPRGDAGFRKKLSEIGLRVVKIDSDGNCFFRAVADQLQGVDGDQAMIRAQVVRFMLENREAFEPFVEDDQGFDLYCEDMEEDGTWAGNMELQAASLLLKVNICIHQAGRPAWSVHNFKDPDARTIHLSYHDGDHYNSLRMSHDRGPGPAVPFRFVDANTAVVQEEGLRSRGNAEPSSSDQASPPKAHEDGTLRRGEMGASSNDKGSRRRRPPGAEESPTITEATGAEGRVDPPRITNIQRQPQRNKRCPCGSGLKYGKCCRPGRTASKAAAQDLPAGDEAQKVVCI